MAKALLVVDCLAISNSTPRAAVRRSLVGQMPHDGSDGAFSLGLASPVTADAVGVKRTAWAE